MCAVIPRNLVGAVPARKPPGAELSQQVGKFRIAAVCGIKPTALPRATVPALHPGQDREIAISPWTGPVAQRLGVGSRPKRDFGSLFGISSTRIWRSPLSTGAKTMGQRFVVGTRPESVSGRNYGGPCLWLVVAVATNVNVPL